MRFDSYVSYYLSRFNETAYARLGYGNMPKQKS